MCRRSDQTADASPARPYGAPRVRASRIASRDRVALAAVSLGAWVTLFGREPERHRISELLEDARRQVSGALVLSGDAGMGKSALCAWALAHADSMRQLTVHGVESEMDLPFAGLSELFVGELDRIASLPAPQARALEGALSRGDAPTGDRFAIGAAVLSLLASIGADGSALVVVDDAQWLDSASADALRFAARRLRSEGVAMLVATRPEGVFAAASTRIPRVDVEELDAAASRALLRESHGPLPTDVTRALLDRAHGTPLALVEIPGLLSAEQLAGDVPIADPLPLGPTLVRALLQRLSGLSDHARLALLVAAASGGERVQPVVDALRALNVPGTVLEDAERAGALSISGDRFEFRHPLLRAAVHHEAGGPLRRAAHAALADATDGDARAWHLAQATVGEDEAVAAELERVGVDADRRGAPVAAAMAYERSARLSPAGEARVRRLTRAARGAFLAGRPSRAAAVLDEALAEGPDRLQRADIHHLRGQILVMQGAIETAFRVLVDQAEQIRDIDPARTARMLADACIDCGLRADIRRAIAVAREAYTVASGADPGVRAVTGCVLACALTLGGERAEAGALLDAALPVLRTVNPLSEGGPLVTLAAQSLFWLERHQAAVELLDPLINAARSASAPTALLMPLSCRAELDLRLGRWDLAAAQANEAANLGEEVAQSAFAAYALETCARLAAATGDEAACRQHASRALALIDEHGNELGRLYVQAALGLLELGCGRVEDAIRCLEVARDIAERNYIDEPNIVHWEADLAEAYARAGRSDAAALAVATLERRASRTGGRWALGVAARCRGITAPAAEIDTSFAAALEHLAAVDARFEVARTHLCHGEALRRAGRRTDARAALGSALEAFDDLGATPWASRTQLELRATGAAPRRRRSLTDSDALTPHELQVARIVAAGASNREAAAALFLSPKTIEFHLGHIYRKLGLRKRTELVALAMARGWLDDASARAAG